MIVDLGFVEIQVFAYLLVLFRVSGLVMTAPFFGSRNIPMQLQIGIAMFLAYLVAPVVDKSALMMPPSLGYLGLAVMAELAVGIMIGFAAAMIFAAVQLAGHYMDQELGIAMANVIDPINAEQVTVIGQFKYMLALAVFILMDAHLLVIQTLVHSFKDIPLAGFVFTDALGRQITGNLITEMFIMSVKLSAPIVVVMLITTIAMGFLARTVPEMNIFILGFSLRIIVGFAVMIIMVQPLFAYVFPGMVVKWFKTVDGLILLMR